LYHVYDYDYAFSALTLLVGCQEGHLARKNLTDDDDDDVTIFMCAQKLTDASLIYRTEPETKTEKKRTKNKMDTGYAQKKRCRARNRGVSPEGRKGSLGWKGFVKQVGFEPGVKNRRSDGW